MVRKKKMETRRNCVRTYLTDRELLVVKRRVLLLGMNASTIFKSIVMGEDCLLIDKSKLLIELNQIGTQIGGINREFAALDHSAKRTDGDNPAFLALLSRYLDQQQLLEQAISKILIRMDDKNKYR